MPDTATPIDECRPPHLPTDIAGQACKPRGKYCVAGIPVRILRVARDPPTGVVVPALPILGARSELLVTMPVSRASGDNAPPTLDHAFTSVDDTTWRRAAEDSLPDGVALDTLVTRTLDGVRVEALYAERPAGPDIEVGSAAPGHAAPAEARSVAPWSNRVLLTGDSVETMRAHALESLAGGVDDIELPVSLDDGSRLDAAGYARLFDGIHPEMITISIAPGDDRDVRAAALETLWNGSARVDPATVRGALNGDPLGDTARTQGATPEFDPDALVNEVETWTTRFPSISTLSVNTLCYHDAGASAATEIAAAIATADRYRAALASANRDATTAARQIGFRLGVSPDYLSTVAKLRAMHRLWAHLLEAHGVRVSGARIVAETGERYRCRRESWANHLRHVVAAAAAAAGGVSTLVVHPHNRVEGRWLDEGTAIGARVARNVAPILAREGRLLEVHEPLAGSYAVERLTEQLVQDAWARLIEWQDAGGFERVLADGSLAERVRDEHDAALAPLLEGERVMVGVNRFPGPTESVTIDESAVAAMRDTARRFPLRRLASAFGQ